MRKLMPISPPPTIIDIAKRAGVSTRAVSSALNGTGRVSEQTRSVIRQIAEEMRYQPRLAAQLMRARTTGGVALIIPTDQAEASESGAHGPLMTNFVDLGETEGIRFHFDFVSKARAAHDPAPQSFKGAYVDGAIVTDSMPQVPALRDYLMSQQRYPWVCINEEAPYCVLSDFDDAAREAIRLLIGVGHRNIAFAFGPLDFISHASARSSFEKAAREYDLRVENESRAYFPYKPRREGIAEYVAWATEVLRRPDHPTAFLCSDMRISRAVIYAALRQGLLVPEDISVTGMGTTGDAEKGYPCLTSIEPDFRALAELSYQMLKELIEGEQCVQSTRRVPGKLVSRDSVANVPRGMLCG
ncbi:MAG: LacI family DNA-binding transcriptional regulator [Capsulimonadaceae bacterium]|nr:LacI family DNA-binding transcriptional regulator [Capsulimonadaceae bacterium]